MSASSALFSPIELRSVRARNRLVVSPMCQYSAHGGFAHDWHFVHLGRFAQGGFGTVFVEATAVEAEGRITHGDTGIWSDAHAAPLARIAAFLKEQGAVPGIQLAHAGRKASAQRPWEGGGPLTEVDVKARGEHPWQTVSASALPHGEKWHVPQALTVADLGRLRDSFRVGAERALKAGFEAVEIHSAHGYLLNQFLAPVSNQRRDGYGGDIHGRMRFPLEVAEAVRVVWPEDKPVFVRISSVDWVKDGWSIEDSVVYAARLKAIGVDVVDCSSGGFSQSVVPPPTPLYQTPFAERIRKETGIKTMAVGLITNAASAEAIVAENRADLVALGREALADPNWPLHAEKALGGDPLDFSLWPIQAGLVLKGREKAFQAQAEKK